MAQRVKTRWRAALVAGGLAALCVLWWASGRVPDVRAPPPALGDCVEIAIWSNGYHTSFALPGAGLAKDHPLRTFAPDAPWYLIGWGDADFYRSDGKDLALGARALLPGGRTTLHLLASEVSPDLIFTPKSMQTVAISREGAAQLGRYLADSVELDEDGAPVFLSEGQVPGKSAFFRGRKHFHVFNVCNHWTARGLRAAGVRNNAALAYTGDGVVEAIRSKAPSACPKP